MAQKIVSGEQYESFLIRGGIDGGPVPVVFASGITISGVTMSAQVEVTNDSGNPLPVSDANSSLTVDGTAYRSVVSFVRPGDTTAYAAGDVIGTSAGSALHTLSGIGPSGGYVLIQSAALFVGNTSVPAGMGAFRAHLYNSAPSGIADNAAFNLTSADQDKYMGYVDISTPLDLGSMLYAQADYPGRLVKLASGSTSLVCQIETRGAYTPASGTAYELRVSTLEAGL